MPQENMEVYRRVLAAFNRGGDADLAEELFDPEVTIEPLVAGGVEQTIYRGRAGAMEFVSDLTEIFEEVHADYSRIEDFGDVLLASGKTAGRGRAGGVPVELPWFVAVRFRLGKVVYAAFRRTRAEALEAAGLRE
jgi:ketosteroid isomerase-like protein